MAGQEDVPRISGAGRIYEGPLRRDRTPSDRREARRDHRAARGHRSPTRRSWPMYDPAKKKVKIDESTKRLLDEIKDHRGPRMKEALTSGREGCSRCGISSSSTSRIDRMRRLRHVDMGSDRRRFERPRTTTNPKESSAKRPEEHRRHELGSQSGSHAAGRQYESRRVRGSERRGSTREDADPAFVLGEAVQKTPGHTEQPGAGSA